MGEEESKTDVSEATENGMTSLSEKPAKAVGEGKEIKEDDGMKEMEEDNKAEERAETEKMDGDSKFKEDEEMKEEKETKEVEDIEEEKENGNEQSKLELMEEENGSNEKEVADEKEGDKEDEKEKPDKVEDNVQKEEEIKKEKGSAERAKGKSGEKKVREKKPKMVEEKKEPEPRTPAIDRPVRERKSVERLVASIEKDSSRELHIEKGQGTPLKDIPNVAFKLSRRKTDDTFRLLHSILFGRRGKAFQFKSNISRFSGFVWHENEEKQRTKVREKFEKCNKEKLLEFCDVLDIPTSKTTRMRKEDIVTSLIDFLVAPYATTTLLLAEKESNKSNKRKRVIKGSSTHKSTPSKCSAKSQIKTESDAKTGKKSTADTDDESDKEEEEEEEEQEEVKEEEKEKSEGEEKENSVCQKSDDEMPEQSESKDKNESEDDSEEEVRNRKPSSKASSAKKDSGGKSRTKKITFSVKSSPPPKRTPKKAANKRSKADEDNDASPKVFSRKNRNEKVTKEKTSTPTKSNPKEKPGENAVKGKERVKEDKLKLTDEKLRDAICEILQEVDFNTATFTDILKQLAKKFDTDLTSRKPSIKHMIQEELTKLADEEDNEDGEGDAEKDETEAAGKQVEV